MKKLIPILFLTALLLAITQPRPAVALSKVYAPYIPTKHDIPALLHALSESRGYDGGNAAEGLWYVIYEPGIIEGFDEILRGNNFDAIRIIAWGADERRPAPQELIPGLIHAAKVVDPEARAAVARALGFVCGKNDDVYETLLAMIQDSDPRVRQAVVESVGRMGGRLKDALPSLITVLDDTDQRVATSAAQAIAKLGPDAVSALPKLAETFGVRWEQNSVSVEESVFIKIGPASIPYLTDIVRTGTVYARNYAMKALPLLDAKISAETLAAAIDPEDVTGSVYIASAMAEIGAVSDDAVKALVAGLKSPDKDVRYQAVQALTKLGPKAGWAIPALIEASYTNEGRMTGVSHAIESIGITNTNNVEGLINLLSNEDHEVREDAVEALMYLGPRASSAVPALKGLLTDKSQPVRETTVKALAKILPPDERDTLLAELAKSEDFTLRKGAVSALGEQDDLSGKGIRSIVATLGDNQFVRDEAIKKLVEIGATAVPYLIEGVSDEDSKVRVNSITALWKIGKDAAPALDAIITALKDRDVSTRIAAAHALPFLGPAAIAALPALRYAAENDQYVNPNNMTYPVRVTARKSIEKIEAMQKSQEGEN